MAGGVSKKQRRALNLKSGAAKAIVTTMARDVLERINRRLTSVYDKLTGAVPGEHDLRPRDIVRRILDAMENHQREGLDGQIYVPNVYILQVAVETEDERQYLRAFLGAEELAAVLAEEIAARDYNVRGMLLFTVEETRPAKTVNGGSAERVRILCKFDPGANGAGVGVPKGTPSSEFGGAEETKALAASSFPKPEARSPHWDDEPGTLPAMAATLARLTVFAPSGEELRTYPLGVIGARIGRSKQAENSIVLDSDPLISKRHVRIACEKGRFVAYDEGSTNGTQVNGQRIPAGQGVPLNSGDEVRIGDTKILFAEVITSDRTRPRNAMPIAVPQTNGASSAPLTGIAPTITGGKAFCLVAGDGTLFPLASQMTLGRALTEDISLVGNGVAAQHAKLSVRDDAVYVEDKGTPGGTFVNGERIPAQFPVALYPDDQVAFGEALLRLQRGFK